MVGVTTPCEGGRLGRSSPDDAALVIFNAEDAFVHPSELHWPEVYVPEPIVDFFQSDVLACQGVRDADPVLLQRIPLLRLTSRTSKCPGYSWGEGSVGAPGAWAGRRNRASLDPRLRADGRRCTHDEPIEADLLRLEIAAGGTRRLRLEGTVHALMAPVLLRRTRARSTRGGCPAESTRRTMWIVARAPWSRRARRCRFG